MAGAELITLERWHDRLPFHEVVQRPALVIRAAYALMFLRRRPKLRPLLELEPALEVPGLGPLAAYARHTQGQTLQRIDDRG